MTDIIASTKRNQTRDDLIAAFDAYTRKEPGSMDRLMKLVREFAFMKVSHLEYEPAFKQLGTADTADDWAQEVSIKVWQGLTGTGSKQFEGTGENFYGWVHKIAFNQASAAFNDLLKEKKTKVPMFTKVEDDDGEEDVEENPLIHADGAGYGAGFRIPASVQGLNRTICNLLLTEVRGADGKHRGRNYAEVALVLNMTEVAVRKKFERLREKVKAEDAQKRSEARQKIDEALREQREGFRERYAKFKEGKR